MDLDCRNLLCSLLSMFPITYPKIAHIIQAELRNERNTAVAINKKTSSGQTRNRLERMSIGMLNEHVNSPVCRNIFAGISPVEQE